MDIVARQLSISRVVVDPSHQGNAESDSTKLEVLGRIGVPCKPFEALPVFTVGSKHVEARRIALEYFFSH